MKPQLQTYEILDELHRSNYNLSLAAERLNTQPHIILSHITPEASQAMMGQIRLKVLFDFYKLWRTVTNLFLTSLIDASPSEIIKAFGMLSDSMSGLLETSQGVSAPAQINQQALILNMLPQEVRESVLTLLNPPETPPIQP